MCVVVGTRPEAIKLAPVLQALRARAGELRPLLVATSQHREMLKQALDTFGLVPDIDLGLMQTGQNLGQFTARAMVALTDCFIEHRPDFLLVQGDTSTVTAAALAAFYQGVPIGHIEAGLRSFDLSSPFPEEVNRRIASATAHVHFAPTKAARDNLLREGIPGGDVHVTGNTVVDALRMVPPRAQFDVPALDALPWTERQVALVTIHRRENLGERLESLCDTMESLVQRHGTLHLVFPVHLNPRVRNVVFARLGNHPRITLLDPLAYPQLLETLRRVHFVMSDSGGIQEEVPSFRKPILVLRDRTERPEVVESGFGRLLGTDPDHIRLAVDELLGNADAYARMTSGDNPFGDGHAAERIVRIVSERLQDSSLTHGPRRQSLDPAMDLLRGMLAMAG